jgi:DNA polymerase (family 10)
VPGRFLIGEAVPVAERIIAMLREVKGVKRIEYAGSLRRAKETIGDLDILVATNDATPVMEAFRSLPMIDEVLGAGETKSSVRLESGLQVDVRALEPSRWGTALQYFTGSQAHNIRLREIAQKQGWSLNEYALTRLDNEDEERAFADEHALYKFLGLPYIPPELREDRGEFNLKDLTDLDDLIDLRNMRGDLQMHTTWSDGAADVMTMARACMALGHDYMLTTDHTQSLAVANGLTPERVALQRKEIDSVNNQIKSEGSKFRVLHGVECEVKADGSLDLPDDVLARCDLVQASVHTSLSQPREQITARAMRAVANPHIDILGHPSGRLINERDGADYDWDALFRAAAKHQVALEINSDPRRLDLSDVNARRAIELGCVLSISTDAHRPESLRNLRYGVGIARRAWVTKDKVVNTWPLEKLLKWAGRSD